MSDHYTAWDGNEYPLPAPAGWQLLSDGRYWPPQDAVTPPPATPQPATPPPVTPPAPAPLPSAPQSFTAAPQPSGGPQAGPQPMPQPGPQSGPPVAGPGPAAGPPEKKRISSGMVILLTILGLFVFVVGGCMLAVRSFVNTAEDAFGEFEESVEQFETNQIEARGEVSIDEGSCRIDEGNPFATVRIANRSGGRSDYTVTVTFTDETGRRLKDGIGDIDSVENGDDALLDIISFEAGIEGALSCAIGDVTRYSSDLGTN